MLLAGCGLPKSHPASNGDMKKSSKCSNCSGCSGYTIDVGGEALFSLTWQIEHVIVSISKETQAVMGTDWRANRRIESDTLAASVAVEPCQ